MRDNLLVALTMELCTVPNIPLSDILQSLAYDRKWGGNVTLPNYLLPIVEHMVNSYEREADHPGVYEYEVVPEMASFLAGWVISTRSFPDMSIILSKLWEVEAKFFRKPSRIPAYRDRSDLLAWITGLWIQNLLFHPEDDPKDVMGFEQQRPIFTPEEVELLQQQLPLLVEHWGMDSLCSLMQAYATTPFNPKS